MNLNQMNLCILHIQTNQANSANIVLELYIIHSNVMWSFENQNYNIHSLKYFNKCG